MLKKPSPKKGAAPKDDHEITETEGDLLVELLHATIKVALMAGRQSSAVTDALLAKGVVSKAELEAHTSDTQPELDRLMRLLEQLRVEMRAYGDIQ